MNSIFNHNSTFLVFITSLFVSTTAVAIEPWVNIFSQLNCKIDANLNCTPSTYSHPDLAGVDWGTRTAAQRMTLFLSNEVQGSLPWCRQFAKLIKSECRIPDPVTVAFFDTKLNLLETTSITSFDSTVDTNATNPLSFKNYFTPAKMVACPNQRMQNETVVCSTNVSNPRWAINGTRIPAFNGFTYMKTKGVKAGANVVTVYEGTAITKAAETQVQVIPLPTISVRCSLFKDSLKATCVATITQEARLNPLRSWFVNGNPTAPICLVGNTCNSGVLPPGTQYIQLIAKTIENQTIRSNVYPLTVSFATAKAVTALKAPRLNAYAPAKGATTVGINTAITLTFNKAIAAGNGSIQIRKKANNSVAQTIGLNDSTQVTITGSVLRIQPKVLLANVTSYYLTIPGGLIKDLEGYSFAGLSNATQYNFTTTKCSPPTNSVSVTYGANTLANCGLVIRSCKKGFAISANKLTCVACPTGKTSNGIVCSP